MSQRFLNFYIIASKKEFFPDIFRGFSLFCTPPSMSYGPEGVDLYMILSKKECLPDLFRGISLFCNLLQCSMSQRLITFLYPPSMPYRPESFVFYIYIYLFFSFFQHHRLFMLMVNFSILHYQNPLMVYQGYNHP